MSDTSTSPTLPTPGLSSVQIPPNEWAWYGIAAICIWVNTAYITFFLLIGLFVHKCPVNFKGETLAQRWDRQDRARAQQNDGNDIDRSGTARDVRNDSQPVYNSPPPPYADARCLHTPPCFHAQPWDAPPVLRAFPLRVPQEAANTVTGFAGFDEIDLGTFRRDGLGRQLPVQRGRGRAVPRRRR